MSTSKNKKRETQAKLFEASVRDGLREAGTLIVKTSAKCAKQVKHTAICDLATNVEETLKVFVADQSGEASLRLLVLAEPIINTIIADRAGKFTQTDDAKKVSRMGRAFGFMSGMAVLTSVIKVFLGQADSKLHENQELSQDAKQVCFAYISDVFTAILMALSSKLESTYRTSRKERAFFAEVLANNDWNQFFKSDNPEGSIADTSPGEDSQV